MNTSLFNLRSKDVQSVNFQVWPGQAVLLTGFGFLEGEFASVLKAISEKGEMPSGDACAAPPTMTTLGSMVDYVSTCCEWALSAARNLMAITVPGSYFLSLSDEAMLGRVVIGMVDLTPAAAKLIPTTMVFGSNDCECCGEEGAGITCADLQSLFTQGSIARYMGIDGAGRCVTGMIPTMNETPFVSVDSSTIDFTTSGVLGHTLTGVVRVSGQPGNSLTVNSDGLYVSQNSETPFQALDTSTIDFTTSGTLNHILAGAVRVSGDAGNSLTIRADGLYVAPPAQIAQTPLTVVDSSTVDLTNSGELGHTVTAVVKVSAAAGNRMSTNVDGLYVPPVVCSDLASIFNQGTPYWILGRDVSGNCVYGPLPQVAFNETPLLSVDSSSIDFTTSGTSNHTITGVVKISAQPGNRVSIAGDGLFVPPLTCSDFVANFPAGVPTTVLGRDALGNCVSGPAPTGGGATVDCATIGAVFTAPLSKTATVKLLARDGGVCGEISPCELVPRTVLTTGGPAASTQFSLAQLKGICGTTSTDPQDDPVIFSNVHSGWAGNGEMTPTAGVTYWPVSSTSFPVVAGRAYVITTMSIYPKFGSGPVLGNLSMQTIPSGGATFSVLDDPWSVPVQSGQFWYGAWVIRAETSGSVILRFDTTDTVNRNAYQMNWVVTEARTTSGQPVIYSDAEQAGSQFTLQSASPNNVMQTASIPGVTLPYDLFVFGAVNVDDPAVVGGLPNKGFAFANGTVLSTQYSSSTLFGGGGGSGSPNPINLQTLTTNFVTVSTPSGTSPSGATVVRVTEAAATDYHYLSGISATGVSGSTVRFELEFEIDPGNTHSSNQFRIGSTNGAAADTVATYSTSDGTVQGAGSNATASVVVLAGNWRRAVIDWAIPAGADPNNFSIEFSSSGSGSFAGSTSRYVNFGAASWTNTTAGGGGSTARPKNVAQAHAWSANATINYGVNTNDLANTTGASTDDHRVVYKGFRFHAEITGTPGETTHTLFQQSTTTVCASDPCVGYTSVVSMSGAQITGSIPEGTAYRLIWRINSSDVARQLLDNRTGTAALAVEMPVASQEIPILLAPNGCATATAEVRIECVQGNPAAASGGLTVGPYRLIHRAYPTS